MSDPIMFTVSLAHSIKIYTGENALNRVGHQQSVLEMKLLVLHNIDTKSKNCQLEDGRYQFG